MVLSIPVVACNTDEVTTSLRLEDESGAMNPRDEPHAMNPRNEPTQ
jgi:hypothetical protein